MKKQAHRAHKLNMDLDRTLGFFSSRPNWNPPPPHLQASVPPLLGEPGGQLTDVDLVPVCS